MGYRPKFDCKCPLYLKETERRIQCAGFSNESSGIPGPSSIKMVFETEKEKLKYIQKNCSNCNPDGCELYKLLLEKYKDI